MKKKMCEKRKGRWLAPHTNTGEERTQMLMEVCLVVCETSFLAPCEILSKSNITIFFFCNTVCFWGIRRIAEVSKDKVRTKAVHRRMSHSKKQRKVVTKKEQLIYRGR